MEGIREISRSYYGRATENEKKSIIEFYYQIDRNNEGKISLVEFKKCASSWLSNEDTFEKLDKNGDGALDFDDILCLYYMEKKVGILTCNRCQVLLLGPHFSCMSCLGKKCGTYDLCCSCYCNAEFIHEHSVDHMLDHHSAFIQTTSNQQKSHRKKEMNELHEIAKAHYQVWSPEVQACAYQFYQSMDTDGDGRVNISEFLTFMKEEEGFRHTPDPHFFQELDLDGNGTLDFYEVMTLYYIIKSGRPFCGGCEKFIPGIYFSCVECFDIEISSFHLCRDCYQSTKCSHNHNGRVQFLDNYTLLRLRRDPAPAQSPTVNSNSAYSTDANNNNSDASAANNNNSDASAANNNNSDVSAANNNNSDASAIATNARWSKWKAALTAFEIALKIANVGVGAAAAAAAAGCTIM